MMATRGAFLRTETRTDATAIASIFYGEPVTVVSGPVVDGGVGWYQIQTRDGQTGWVAETLLSDVAPVTAGDQTSFPAATATVLQSAYTALPPSPSPVATMGSAPVRCSKWRVTAPTTLRVGSSASGATEFSVLPNALFTVLDPVPPSDQPGWVYGNLEGRTGWIRRDVLANAPGLAPECPEPGLEVLKELNELNTVWPLSSDRWLLISVLVVGMLGVVSVFRLTRVEHLTTKTVTVLSTVIPVVTVAVGLVGIFLPIPGPTWLPLPTWLVWVGIIYGVNSLVALAVFRYDKWAAVEEMYRVPERILHLVEFLGGWPGALFAIPAFRHKNRKIEFLVLTGLIVLAHVSYWFWISQR